MNLTALIIQLIAGALGGNAIGNVAKDVNLGPVGNSIAGALGGGIGGQLLSSILGIGGAAATSGLDIGSIVSAFLTGGVSGGLTALVVGFLKAKMASQKLATGGAVIAILKQGLSGQPVKRSQGNLGVEADAVLGSATEKALKDWQAKHGLVVP